MIWHSVVVANMDNYILITRWIHRSDMSSPQGINMSFILEEGHLSDLKIIITLHIDWDLLMIHLWSVEPPLNINSI